MVEITNSQLLVVTPNTSLYEPSRATPRLIRFTNDPVAACRMTSNITAPEEVTVPAAALTPKL